jgi:copper resistance protein B
MTARPRSALAGALAAALLLAAGPARAEKMDDQLFTLFKIDELEHRWQKGEDIVTWDGQFRIGNDDHKLALKSEGEYVPDADRFHGAEIQALYLRRISDFFDAQIGVRQDLEPRPTRAYGVIGASGLAPQWFEVDANLFISERGHASARLEAEYDVLLTQRLVLEASGELDAAFADDRAAGIGGGLSSVELGLRLRYEIEREFAPYIGINWERKLGRTADLARADGEEAGAFALVVGLRLWF